MNTVSSLHMGRKSHMNNLIKLGGIFKKDLHIFFRIKKQ